MLLNGIGLPAHPAYPGGKWTLGFAYDIREIGLRLPGERECGLVPCRRTKATLRFSCGQGPERITPFRLTGEAHCSPRDQFTKEQGRAVAIRDLHARLAGDGFTDLGPWPPDAQPLLDGLSDAVRRRELAGRVVQCYFRRRR